MLSQLPVSTDRVSDPHLQKVLQLAAYLLERSQQLQTPHEHQQQSELDRLIQNPNDKHILTSITDQSFRSLSAQRSADQLIHVLDLQGIPRFFSPLERMMLKGFQSFGDLLPGVAMPMVKERMRKETANVILPAEDKELNTHLDQRRAQGVRMNVNILGEALLGEQEAQRRLDKYIHILENPHVECLSVKISTIYSQISHLAHDHCQDLLCERLAKLYRCSLQHQFQSSDGSFTTKFVYLDMEEYSDLHLTATVFMHCLDAPEFLQVRAGIVLQAYIPDSYQYLEKIAQWSQQRVHNNGSAITIRIVKGANMEMEQVHASLSNLPSPCYHLKSDTDANYKRMVKYSMQHCQQDHLQLGIASHNLFDIAYALVLCDELNCGHMVQFEMLEGMANHQRRAIHEVWHNILLYAPACRKEHFTNAIAYLIRRLDENTGVDNFLRYSFNLEVNTPIWKRLQDGFISSYIKITTVSDQALRQQNRLHTDLDAGAVEKNSPAKNWWTYDNEPDTDFSLPDNYTWSQHIIDSTKQLNHQSIPIVIAGKELNNQTTQPLHHRPLGVYHRASIKDIDSALSCAQKDPQQWSSFNHGKRNLILRRVAHNIRSARSQLIAAALTECNKCIEQTDGEISEAVDFVEFYSLCSQYYSRLDGLRTEAIGVVTVISPWNFPIAIPCGGIAAALASGNRVLLKPAAEAVYCAWLLCQCFWQAGISQETLQFIPCNEDDVGTALIKDSRNNAIILTGATSTAEHFLRTHPAMNLCAETGGKNAMIVSDLADHELAIKHIVQSAFAHAGQKCSACSLLLLQQDVYEDAKFLESLKDASQSLWVSLASDPRCKINPLINECSATTAFAMKECAPNERWLLQAQQSAQDSRLWSPGIKLGVQAGGLMHMEEFFAPLLAVMPYKHLHQAIDIVNSTGYGLCSGLHSLDEREHLQWKSQIRAGNLYINRSITGAMVLRQPFGGMGLSSFGSGLKAGGPNYISQFFTWHETEHVNYDRLLIRKSLRDFLDDLRHLPEIDETTHRDLEQACASYAYWAKTEFLQEHDHVKIIGQDNIRRYLPVDKLRIRVTPYDSSFSIIARIAAARSVDTRCILSYDPQCNLTFISALHQSISHWGAAIEWLEESDQELMEALETGQCHRLRYQHSTNPQHAMSPLLLNSAHQNHCHIIDQPVLKHGRIELLHYVQEQSISYDYHRYGNSGDRKSEQRKPLIQQ
ncbi:MAG: proline dehydrogenase family protein [Planctomycetes bacterium]|nr:proline dehydrogenase family protein [Planctomycetota bacterium]